MGLRIDLPSAGLLGISGATGGVITGNTTAVQNGIYIIEGSNSLTITLPATFEVGGTVLVKNTGTGTVTITSSADIENSSSNVTMNTQNEFIRFVYVSAAYGYLKA
jgi:hypothetical protein